MTRTGTDLSIEEYFDRLHSLVCALPSERAALSQGRVLAEPLVARLPLPAHDNSAMDGFLIPQPSSPDSLTVPFTLPVVGDVPAGSPAQTPPPGTALRIMTGGPVPAGFDGLVIPVEDTDIPPGPGPLPETVTVHRLPGRNHIRRRGSHVEAGHQLAGAATLVDASLIAAALSASVDTAVLHRTPRVTVIATGEELLNGQLPDSNGPMLDALLSTTGPVDIARTVCGDSPVELRRRFDAAAADSDLIVTTGGVSAGAFDVVRAVVEDAVERGSYWFGHVNQRPGAPQGHALWDGVPVVCLPGNPVAAFVSAHLYLTPLMRSLRGLPRPTGVLDRPHLTAVAGADFPHPHRPLIQPCSIAMAGSITAFPPPGPRMRSHHVAALPGTQGFALLTSPVTTGEQLTVYPY
ncbi:molybdopterin molybdotransferase MoeA [Corynebacterium aurimucosum]|uniref:Molybdopterin molybdenumtransferase n=1 Tax=Corynebacterium aurimucosum (strain ATCC 700975 / DSM 44827 / CIP 107346 / CN-1) TaxID=548476 RepID=C3PFQ0_CORA7|nr:molybdopterin molybdotransferase MoeA [Corynebacterium aurimucosum]ACP32654.1 molybdenum cofactor biosynthesis protein [Corynebacterium aurimucosum ATCC 700975]QQU93173.1 molybdopterin molybdotransferase MoeA [Corynebacterium aurimucosum]